MGYEPVMSDFSDVLYDPRHHTHTNCIADVPNADVVILLIGSRFGGTAVPQALPIVSAEAAREASTSTRAVEDMTKLSITQVETLKAIEEGIPIFAFVDARVHADHHVYQSNKQNDLARSIKYPSIDKPETASYIFEFINYLTHRLTNNAIVSYSNFGDIEEHLVKQWSLLFQRLLQEQRARASDARRAEFITEQLEDLKAVVLQSITTPQAREIAQNVLRYRRLIDFLLTVSVVNPTFDIVNFPGDFDHVLAELDVVDILRPDYGPTGMGPYPIILLREDGTFIGVRLAPRLFDQLFVDWGGFNRLSASLKEAIVEGIRDSGPQTMAARVFNESYDPARWGLSEKPTFRLEPVSTMTRAPPPASVRKTKRKAVKKASKTRRSTAKRKGS